MAGVPAPARAEAVGPVARTSSARARVYSMGILHSTYHRRYFEERCSKMRVDL